ncbi:MAG: hypothetical protein PHG54_14260 [Smithellaceae bacterium]|nr:hypothetical protein [Syntrophaceae bacterium]MDD4242588.1 hypothetical protein [Smithellaceae bacterium]NLX50879.1 hypothetical protein [Deltaproteobacteria bacterium]
MPSVGDSIDAYCLKCKLLLDHVVLFKVGGAVKRVQCRTCGTQHQYRPAAQADRKNTAEKKPAVRKTAAAKKADAAQALAGQAALAWDRKTRETPPDMPIRDYSLGEIYRLNDVIRHPIFGVGFVEKVVSDKSISVLFSDAVRLMGMHIAP